MWVSAHAAVGLHWATFAVNVLGSLLLGLVLGLYPTPDAGVPVRALVATGFCGAFTTFSTFGFETLMMLQARAYGEAALYVLASTAAGVAAAAAGFSVGSRLA